MRSLSVCLFLQFVSVLRRQWLGTPEVRWRCACGLPCASFCSSPVCQIKTPCTVVIATVKIYFECIVANVPVMFTSRFIFKSGIVNRGRSEFILNDQTKNVLFYSFYSRSVFFFYFDSCITRWDCALLCFFRLKKNDCFVTFGAWFSSDSSDGENSSYKRFGEHARRENISRVLFCFLHEWINLCCFCCSPNIACKPRSADCIFLASTVSFVVLLQALQFVSC